MKTRIDFFSVAIVGALVLIGAALVHSEDASNVSPSANDAGANEAGADSPELTAARDRAKLLHKVYASSLEMMHDRYFHDDKATVPARALEDVFKELARDTKIEARWIGVNAKIMGINHEPKDDFEKAAAAAIGAGKGSYEAVENGKLRRAASIDLHAGCLSCHGTFGIEPKTPRFAGLVLTLPLKAQD
jgi:hypothetical protein